MLGAWLWSCVIGLLISDGESEAARTVASLARAVLTGV